MSNDYHYTRTYRGPLKAAIFDMAGTVVDHGSRAPAGAFMELYSRHDVEITEAQAREPMGMHKRDHIRAISRMPPVAARWQEVHGAPCTETDVEAMYEEFTPLQLDALPRHGDVIPGAADALVELRKLGMGVAFTTGYNRPMMEVALGSLAAQGVEPDAAFCADDVPTGRPAPWLIYHAMEALGVYPPQAVVKVGDTLPDIEAGLSAGVWSVGVTASGSLLGLSNEELMDLELAEREARVDAAGQEMLRAGAHMVVESVHDMSSVLFELHARLGRGERP